MSAITNWLPGLAGLLVLGAATGWLLRLSRRHPEGMMSAEELPPSSAYRLPLGARIMAGLLALAILGSLAFFIRPSALRSRNAIGSVLVALLLLYGAWSGKSPAWLESSEEANRAIDRLLARWRSRK